MLRCKHCLLPVYEREAIYDDEGNVFCCEGCKGVYRLIKHEGLSRFYRDRKWDAQEGQRGRGLFNRVDAAHFEDLVRTDEKGLKLVDLFIENIRCAACVWLNEKVLHRTRGIISARVNYATHRAQIKWDPKELSLQDILDRIISIGYRPKPYSESEHLSQQRSEIKDLLIRFGTASFLSSQLMVYTIALYAGYFQGIEQDTKLVLELIALFLTAPVVFYSGMPFIRNTLAGLRHMHFTMDALITAGALSAFIFSIYQIFIGGKVYFDTASMIITLILLGRYIEATAKGRASETLQKLGELIPKEARRVVSGVEERVEMVPVSALKIGDLIRILPGERIPIDGRVIEGETETDESLISGESMPIFRGKGDLLIGGSINLNGSILIEATKTLKETMLSGIIDAVREAQMRTPKIQRIADKVVGFFVPLILLIALATVSVYLIKGYPLHESIMVGISVLVIACPCSLGLATPLAVLIATTMTTSRGLLIKGGDVIEKVKLIDRVIFDKTGTLTLGNPTVKEVVLLDRSITEEEALHLAASLEKHSEHSIAKAIVNASRTLSMYEATDIRIMPGRGIRGTVKGREIALGNSALMKDNKLLIGEQGLSAEVYEQRGNTVVYIGWEGAVRAFFVVADVLRQEVRAMVEMLNKLRREVYVLSGDNALTTSVIASQAGISHVIAEATPQLKQEIIRKFHSEGRSTLMVGDGINDAPALTEATVGAAMAKGTDIAMESADVVIVREDLLTIPFLIRISEKTYGIIKQNIFLSFLYNITAVPLAMAGMLHPIVAAAAMAASSLCVVSNSLRIRRT